MTIVESSARLSCTENAALLSTINEVPGEDVKNILERDKNAKDGGFLTLEQELTLATALARLSRVTKNPHHITAVCVERKLEGPELVVRVAVNKASPEDGEEILGSVVKGFNGIFLLLVKLSNDHQDIKLARSQVLRRIIILCCPCILDRLGSSSAMVPQASRKKKPCLYKMLQSATAALRSIGVQAQHQPSIDQLERLGTLVQDYEGCDDNIQSREHLLEDILVGCRRLNKSTNLDGLLGLLPSTSLRPDTRSALVRRIAKLGQYAAISKQLCSLALEVPALASMRAVPVMLPPETLRSTVPTSYEPQLSTALARSVGKTRGLSTTSDALCKKLNTTTKKASQKFAKDVGDIHLDAKCHAEVQILFEYEMRPCHPAPRVVASSKSACYLCNALFRAHGKYHIPRTHGRLYRGWKLPAINLATMKGVEAEFVNALERAIGQNLKRLLNGHGPLKFNYPNESTLSIRPTSSQSTVTTATMSVARTPSLEMMEPRPAQSNDDSEIAAVEAQGCLDVPHEYRPTASELRVEQKERAHSHVSHSDAEAEPPRQPTSRALSPSSHQTKPGDLEHTIITLQQGKVRNINLHPGYSPIIRTRNLYVHIEWPSNNMDQGRPDDSCIALMAEWLSIEDADRHKCVHVIQEARNLSTEFETQCSGNGDVFLRSGDEVIKIRRMENRVDSRTG